MGDVIKSRILLVEDDNSIGITLSQKLTAEGYLAHLCTNAASAETEISISNWDLYIFDLNLPDGNGFRLAELATKKNKDTPIILITALNTAENRLASLELGVHEFIPKPFLFKELLLRLQRLLKVKFQETAILVSTGKLDLEKRCFISNINQTSFFTGRDFSVLKLLIEKSPQPVSREDILDLVCGTEQFPTLRTVDNSVTRLRQILLDKDGQFIRSVRGVGYQWVSNVGISDGGVS